MPGSAHDIAAHYDNFAGTDETDDWVIGTNAYDGGYQVWRWNPRTHAWNPSNRGGVRITADRFGRPFVANNLAEIWFTPNAPFAGDENQTAVWQQLPGCATDVASGGPDGSLVRRL
jgi:hypothetical protein